MRTWVTWFLLIEGGLALGFIIPFVVSINIGDVIGITFFPVIMLFAGASFFPKFNKMMLGWTLLLTALFSWLFSGLVPTKGGALSVLWAILFWLPIVLMCFLKFAPSSLTHNINRGITIWGVSEFFLGMGMICGMTRAEKMYVEELGIYLTGTHVFLLFVTIFSLAFFGVYQTKKKRAQNEGMRVLAFWIRVIHLFSLLTSIPQASKRKAPQDS